MRLTPSRAVFAALLLLVPAVPFVLAQEQAPETPPALEAPPSEAPLEDAPAEDADAAPAAEQPAHPRSEAEIYRNLAFFGEVFDRVRKEYVDAPDEQELIRAAINGMLTSLDPHSNYLDPASFATVQEDTSGQFGGLGIEVTMENEVIKVVSPIDDTPAQRAGILANDLIVELDGKPVQGLSVDEAVSRMKGPVGTKIKLTVVREGVSEPLYFELTRDIISQRVTRWSMEGDVALIRLIRFTEQAYPGLNKAIKDIYDQRKGVPPKGIILDLRNNPGGLVEQAVYVADAFLRDGAVVLTRGRDESESARYSAKPDDLDARIADLPVVVLINGGSASAAEIVAGALQDHKRATLIGTRSFGKGSVQSIIHLGADGGIRLTTARYFTPNNRSIQAAGIHPDIVVKENVPAEFAGRDEILGEAGLSGQIGGGTEDEATTGSSVYVPADKAEDTQLQFAIGLIEGTRTDAAFPPRAAG
jgi:carboxyl-terminal processing protease